MLVHDLSASAVGNMECIDLATVSEEPASPIEPFDFHGCYCGVASFVGQPPWEWHEGDELLHVLAGAFRFTVREPAGEIVREFKEGDLVIVPARCWHRSDAPGGVTLLFMTPPGGRHSWNDPEAAT
ncbi:MAG TPA: cupin domain-containing protein [Caulobacteraceae bacterium]|nr:cupin domain-containing protein [Caulobacteraceae bacterium]